MNVDKCKIPYAYFRSHFIFKNDCHSSTSIPLREGKKNVKHVIIWKILFFYFSTVYGLTLNRISMHANGKSNHQIYKFNKSRSQADISISNYIDKLKIPKSEHKCKKKMTKMI